MTTRGEALDLFRSPDLIGIGMAADAVRRKWHPENVVSYIIDRNINYTNFCTEYCTFCAFYRPMGHAEGYVLPQETIFAKIRETIDLGGTGVLMQGGLHPDLKIEWYEDLFRAIKRRFRIHLHCLSAPEVANIAEVSGLSLRDTIARLRDAGLDSIPGGGAEILDDAVRQRISRLKCRRERVDGRSPHRPPARHAHHRHHDVRLRRNHRAAHEPPGAGPQPARGDRRIHGVHPVDLPAREHLARPQFVKDEATAVEYLQTLAISRIYLDNFENVQSSWVTQGLKTCQLGLRFGGNDVGSIMIEENVVSAAGAHYRASEEELRRIIRDAGFVPQAKGHAIPHVLPELSSWRHARARAPPAKTATRVAVLFCNWQILRYLRFSKPPRLAVCPLGGPTL